MKLYHIALNSLWRRKSRVLFLLVGLVIAVSTVVILVNISEAMNTEIENKLDSYGANILVIPRSNEFSLSYGGMPVSDISLEATKLSESDIAKIRTIKNSKNIKIIAPKLLNVAEVNQKKCLVVGIDFEQEFALKKWWSISGTNPVDEQEALIGIEIRRELNLRLNDKILIDDHSFTVKGILEETGSQDDEMVFIHLKKAQEIFNKPASISLIEISALCYDCPIEEIVAQTSRKLTGARVTAVRQTINSKMETVQQFRNFSLGISIVILFVAALIILTTMSASVNERTREIGIFRAIGFRQKHIMQIILIEASLISGLAGLLGYAAGLVVASYIGPLVGTVSTSVKIDILMFLLVLTAAVVFGISASFYPAIKAARLDPATALRSL